MLLSEALATLCKNKTGYIYREDQPEIILRWSEESTAFISCRRADPNYRFVVIPHGRDFSLLDVVSLHWNYASDNEQPKEITEEKEMPLDTDKKGNTWKKHWLYSTAIIFVIVLSTLLAGYMVFAMITAMVMAFL